MEALKWTVIGLVVFCGPALGQSVQANNQSVRELRKVITNMHPKTKVAKVDREKLTARRIDVVDKKGVIRFTLAGDQPNPVVDGIEYKRSIGGSGLLIRDDNGNERGALGFNSTRSSAQFVLDYDANDAIALMTLADGTSEILMNSMAPAFHHPAFGNKKLPLGQGKTRIELKLSPDGTPEIALADKNEQPRLRLTVTNEGYGAIEFLDAQGRIISTVAPERDLAEARQRAK